MTGFAGRHLVVIILLCCTLVSGALVYTLTHYQYQQLNQQLRVQQTQLKKLAQYQKALAIAPLQEVPILSADQVEWHFAQWAEELGVSLTLTRDKPQQRLSLSLLHINHHLLEQYLRRFLNLQQPHSHQRLSLQQQQPDQLQFHWQLSQDINQHGIQHTGPAPMAAASSCHQRPPAAALKQSLPALSKLRLAAIATHLKQNKRQAYFTNRQGNWLALSEGAWLQEPVTQIIAINEDSLQLKQWRPHQGCWDVHPVNLTLKE